MQADAYPCDLHARATTIGPTARALTAGALGIVSISQIAYTRAGASLALNPPLTPAEDTLTIPYYNVYFSDTWHMKPTFTLTYGLGWTLEQPPTEATGKQDVLVDASDTPISMTGLPGAAQSRGANRPSLQSRSSVLPWYITLGTG